MSDSLKAFQPALIGIGVGLVGVAAVGCIGFLIYKKRDAFNPLNNNNVFAKAANSVVASVTDGKYLSVGGALFGETKAERDINKPVTQADIDAYRAQKRASAGASASNEVLPSGPSGPNDWGIPL